MWQHMVCVGTTSSAKYWLILVTKFDWTPGLDGLHTVSVRARCQLNKGANENAYNVTFVEMTALGFMALPTFYLAITFHIHIFESIGRNKCNNLAEKRSFHLLLDLLSGLSPSGLPTKTLHTPLLSPTRGTCPVHLILDLITRTIFGEQYRELSSSLCSFLHCNNV